MLGKNEAKYIQSLYYKKNRDAQGLFIAEGEKTAAEIISSDWKIKKIYAVKEWIDNNQNLANTQVVAAHELARLSKLSNANKVLLVVEKKNELPVETTNGITLVLDGIQDPGNMGTIIRTADWFGIKNIIASDDCADVYNHKVIQSSMGSFLRVTVFYTTLVTYLQQNQLPVYAAVLNGENIFTTTIVNDALIVIGSEGAGISKEIMPYLTHKITIPGRGKAESLNAAVAAGVIMAQVAGNQ